MSTDSNQGEGRIIPEGITVPFTDDYESLRNSVERRLQQVYGSGTYLSDFSIADSGSLAISIGNAFPTDVSDCRPNRERVIKYIALDDIAELSGKRDGEIYYIELPSRSSVERGFSDAQENLRNELDIELRDGNLHPKRPLEKYDLDTNRERDYHDRQR